MGTKQILIMIYFLQLNFNPIYSMEKLEESEEIELDEITDENRIIFFGKAEDIELFDYIIEQFDVEMDDANNDNINDNYDHYWNNLQSHIDNFDNEQKPEALNKILTSKKNIPEDIFPLEGLPNELLICIASLLIAKDSELITYETDDPKNKDKVRVEKGPAKIYRNISYFLRTCKRFYCLKDRIDKIILEKLEKLSDKSLEEKLQQQRESNPFIDMAHIAVGYERMIWLTAWILKSKKTGCFDELINTKDTLSRTPLHWAAFYNKPRIIYMLVKAGANIESKDFLGNTPLHITTFRGSFNAAEILLTLNANPNCRNNKYRNPLHEVAFKNNFNMVRLLIDYGAKLNNIAELNRTPLHEVALNNCWATTPFLLASGAHVNVQDIHGDTPLHLAAFCGSTDVAKQLLKHGATNTIRNWAMQKPTEVARARGNHYLAETIKIEDSDCDII